MNSLTLEEAHELLLIDKQNLDEECVQQPQLFSTVAEQYSMANSLSDKAKENLNQVNAQVASKLRTDAEVKGAKVTEARLQELILLDSDHKQAFLEYIEAKLLADRWYNMKDCFTQRSFMLKDMCALFHAQYFIKTTIEVNPSAIEKEVDENRKILAQGRTFKIPNR